MHHASQAIFRNFRTTWIFRVHGFPNLLQHQFVDLTIPDCVSGLHDVYSWRLTRQVKTYNCRVEYFPFPYEFTSYREEEPSGSSSSRLREADTHRGFGGIWQDSLDEGETPSCLRTECFLLIVSIVAILKIKGPPSTHSPCTLPWDNPWRSAPEPSSNRCRQGRIPL